MAMGGGTVSTGSSSAASGSDGRRGAVVGGGATTASSYEGIGALTFGRDMFAMTKTMRKGFCSVRLAVFPTLHEVRSGRLCCAKHAVVLIEGLERRKARRDVHHLQTSESYHLPRHPTSCHRPNSPLHLIEFLMSS